MLEGQSSQGTGLIVDGHQVLIAVPETEDGQEVTRYFVDEETADRAMPQGVTEEALKAVGAWRDLDWLEMEEALDRIRHANVPTPPVEL